MWAHVEPYADRLNPDGVHWPSEAHAAVGRAVATAVADGLARLPEMGVKLTEPLTAKDFEWLDASLD